MVTYFSSLYEMSISVSLLGDIDIIDSKNDVCQHYCQWWTFIIEHCHSSCGVLIFIQQKINIYCIMHVVLCCRCNFLCVFSSKISLLRVLSSILLLKIMWSCRKGGQAWNYHMLRLFITYKLSFTKFFLAYSCSLKMLSKYFSQAMILSKFFNNLWQFS